MGADLPTNTSVFPSWDPHSTNAARSHIQVPPITYNLHNWQLH